MLIFVYQSSKARVQETIPELPQLLLLVPMALQQGNHQQPAGGLKNLRHSHYSRIFLLWSFLVPLSILPKAK